MLGLSTRKMHATSIPEQNKVNKQKAARLRPKSESAARQETRKGVPYIILCERSKSFEMRPTLAGLMPTVPTGETGALRASDPAPKRSVNGWGMLRLETCGSKAQTGIVVAGNVLCLVVGGNVRSDILANWIYI